MTGFYLPDFIKLFPFLKFAGIYALESRTLAQNFRFFSQTFLHIKLYINTTHRLDNHPIPLPWLFESE